MKYQIRVCDICSRATEPNEFYRIKVRSSAFNTYGDLFGDRETFDVCKPCLDKAITYIRLMTELEK